MSTFFVVLISAAIAGPGQQGDDLSESDPLFPQTSDTMDLDPIYPDRCDTIEPLQTCRGHFPGLPERPPVEIDCGALIAGGSPEEGLYLRKRTPKEQREYVQALLDTVEPDDVVRLMSDCEVDHGLILGPDYTSTTEPPLSCILFDGNGFEIRATDDMTTMGQDDDGLKQVRCVDHNRVDPEDETADCNDPYPLLTVRTIDDLVIRDLALDGNWDGRLGRWDDISQTAKYASSTNLTLVAVTDATVWNVDSASCAISTYARPLLMTV